MRRKTIVFSLFVFSLIGGPSFALEGAQSIDAGHHLDVNSRIKAGPALDGDAYLALRDAEEFTVLKFDLLVAGESEEIWPAVILGRDFVIEQTDFQITIYDYRFRRLLNMEAAGDQFSNESLFGYWRTRWAFLQNNMGTAGILASVSLVEDPDLERFWTEQKNGVAHPQQVAHKEFPRPDIQEVDEGGGKSYFVGDQKVAEVSFGEIEFPSDAHAQTFAAWLVWSRSVHPQIASLIAKKSKLPTRINKIVRANLAADPAGILLSLDGAVRGATDMGIIAGRSPIAPGWEPKSPQSLGELMIAAARGEAPNGPLSGDEYKRALKQSQKKGKPLDVALLAVHASHGCGESQPEPAICAIAINALREGLSDKNVSALFDALGKDQNGQHGAGAKALIALEYLLPARSDIMNIMLANMLVEAKNKDQLDDALKERFNALPSLFEEAFRQDPYAPARYRDYYNYLHASTASIDDAYLVHAKASPVIDLARSIPERRVPNIVREISTVEQRIAADFPAHFPDFNP